MDHTKVAEYLERYHENPFPVSSSLIHSMLECSARNRNKPEVYDHADDKEDFMRNIYYWKAYINMTFHKLKEYRKGITCVFENEKDHTAADFDLGELTSKNENGNITGLDAKAAFHIMVAVEECLELSAELLNLLSVGEDSMKEYNPIGLIEEISDVLGAIDYVKTIADLSTEDIEYMQLVKSTRQLARQGITPNLYEDYKEVFQLHAKRRIASLPDIAKEMIQEQMEDK